MGKQRNHPPLAERFSRRLVLDPSGCWLFMGHRNPKGYGICASAPGFSVLAHRRSYQIAYGRIPDGLDVHHTCHVRHCVNPEHLAAVSHERNTQERKGADVRSLTGVRNVSYAHGRYRVVVKHHGRNHWGGSYGAIEEAAARAVEFRREVFGS